MISNIAQISTLAILTLSQLVAPALPDHTLASREISLNDRYPVSTVNEVFKDNILLNLAYMQGKVQKASDINWGGVRSPSQFDFKLDPGKTFAFHDDILDTYKDSLTQTTKAHFSATEGFKSDGYLYGDGVCHLASLIYWVAKEANLDAKAPTSHDFMNIPEIDKQYGVSIYNNPFSKGSNAQQNLYITNNKNKQVEFKFDYSEDKVKVSVIEVN